jgi:hypothetical protein
MTPAELPRTAAWEHRDARTGFEVVVVERTRDGGHVFRGTTTAVESGVAWVVEYEIDVGADWHTRSARVSTRSATGVHSVALTAVGGLRWHVDGRHDPRVDGCPDVDLEASALTNTLPVHRLRLPVGHSAPAPAVYVRVPDSAVEVLPQTYHRLPDGPDGELYDYDSPTASFRGTLVFDRAGLALTYPGIAVRRL